MKNYNQELNYITYKDVNLWGESQKYWNNLREDDKQDIKSSLLIDTDLVSSTEIPVSISLI